MLEGIINVEYERDGVAIEKKYYLGKDVLLTDFVTKKYAQILSSILDEFDIDIVHINSQVGHTFDIFTVPAFKTYSNCLYYPRLFLYLPDISSCRLSRRILRYLHGRRRTK